MWNVAASRPRTHQPRRPTSFAWGDCSAVWWCQLYLRSDLHVVSKSQITLSIQVSILTECIHIMPMYILYVHCTIWYSSIQHMAMLIHNFQPKPCFQSVKAWHPSPEEVVVHPGSQPQDDGPGPLLLVIFQLLDFLGHPWTREIGHWHFNGWKKA